MTPENELFVFLAAMFSSLIFTLSWFAVCDQDNYTTCDTCEEAPITQDPQVLPPTNPHWEPIPMLATLASLILLMFLGTAAQAQTFIKQAIRPTGDTVQIFSDYGTDNYYFGKDSTKVYCATSPIPTTTPTATVLTAKSLQPKIYSYV